MKTLNRKVAPTDFRGALRDGHFRPVTTGIIGRIDDVKNCDVCETPFMPSTAWHKRCSKKCNSIAGNAKNGVGIAEVEEMRRRQNDLCAICGVNVSEDFHVDHDHASGRVRELLCMKCNTLLGHSSDSIDVLKRAIQYLERHSE